MPFLFYIHPNLTIDPPLTPTDKGFDSFFGYLNQRKAHSYYPEYLWSNKEKVLYPENRGHDHTVPNRFDEKSRIIVNGVEASEKAQYAFDIYAEKSLEFVRRNAENSFFLYLAYTPPHGALECPDLERYAGLDWPSVNHKLWAAMITRSTISSIIEVHGKG